MLFASFASICNAVTF